MSSNFTMPPPGLADALLPRAWEGSLRLRWTDRRGAHTAEVRSTVLGSSENAGLVIDDPSVSRIHAEIEVGADAAWIRDLGSRNGTFVDRVEVKTAKVDAGRRLRLGGTEIEVERVTPAAEEVDLWPSPHFGPLVGRSAPMRRLFAMLSQVAQSDIPILIRGETGSGKEVVARAIHEASPRRSQPYVVVDCAALAESLLESELFGHARGAFTGATSSREGAIEAAHGGTVFLDEIGELPLDMQPKLLRVLEAHAVRRVGESDYRSVDVRFVAATHRDLVDHVARGWFREDLYFRLVVLAVRVPPLRERLDDVELLARHFLGPEAEALLTSSLLADLEARTWRGNVRELRNVLARVRALGAARALAHDAHDETALQSPSPKAAVVANGPDVSVPGPLLEIPHREFRERWAELGEKAYLGWHLEKNGGNVARVSRNVELARTYTHKLIKKHGL